MTEGIATEVPAGLRLAGYGFEHPEGLVAERPCEPRDAARLLVLDRRSGSVEHATFRDLPRFLRPGDCLVLNRSRVLPARLLGAKRTGGKIELLLVRETAPGCWLAIASGAKPGAVALLPEGWTVELGSPSGGEWPCRFSGTDVRGFLGRHGLPPLPPYILKRRAGRASGAADAEAYQTVYAREEGSIAAPTAGLHFTPELLERLAAGGVQRAEVLLHVGPGTFRPVLTEDIRSHRMLPEWYRLEEDSIGTMRAARERGGRVVAVGTTAARALETWAGGGAPEGESSLFITPGHEFKAFDGFITNFHLPRSTPLILTAAFAGRERLLNVYEQAIACGYRLFSYGDAMLVL